MREKPLSNDIKAIVQCRNCNEINTCEFYDLTDDQMINQSARIQNPIEVQIASVQQLKIWRLVIGQCLTSNKMVAIDAGRSRSEGIKALRNSETTSTVSVFIDKLSIAPNIPLFDSQFEDLTGGKLDHNPTAQD